MEKINIFVIVIFVIFLIFFTIEYSNKNSKEDLSYSFGFPTHGSYNYGGGPLVGAWPNLLMYPGWNNYYSPFMGNQFYRPPYLGNYLHYAE